MVEVWDLYNDKKQLTHQHYQRGCNNNIPKGMFHLVVEIWIIHNGKILITQRHPEKCYGLKWECSGGSVLQGEDNLVKRNFKHQEQLNVVVSDLTYVRVGMSWHYICILIDLFNREMIGYSSGRNKDASLVSKAFASVKVNLNNIQIFHTDRGNEFKNQAIDDTLKAFHIKRSLSMKGCPYDNAVAEATFKVIKTEFVYNERFESLEELQYKLADYVNWFNNHRIHSAIGYLTPYQYKMNHLKNIV